METILSQATISLTKDDAVDLARHRHPVALTLLVIAVGWLALLSYNDDNVVTLGWLLVVVAVIGFAIWFNSRLRAATVAALIGDEPSADIHYAVTGRSMIVSHPDATLTRNWDSITSTRIDRGFLTLLAASGVITIPMAHAPEALLEAISEQLRQRGVSDPPDQPSFRRTYILLLWLLAVVTMVLLLGDGPPDLCDENPGLEYWDRDGWHRC